MAVALIYNWWSLFVRLGNPKALGGDHQSTLSTLGRGAPEQSWRCAASHHHSSARRGGQSEIAARWYPWVVGSIQSSCGAVENQVGLATPL